MQLLEITVNMHFGKYDAGDKIVVKGKDGIPLESYWRKKVTDSKRDNCISIKRWGLSHSKAEDKLMRVNNTKTSPSLPKKRTQKTPKSHSRGCNND